MASIELTAKSIEEAQKLAAEQLGVSASAVTITVLEESKKLFGKVSYKVRAEADVPVAAEAKAEAPAKKPARAKAVKAEAEPVAEPAAEEAAPAAEAPAAGGRRKLGSSKPAAEAAPAAEADKPAARADRPARAPKVAGATDAPAAEAAPEEDIVATQQDADTLLEIFARVIDGSGLVAQVTLSELQGKYMNLSISGESASYFIGKTGEVLNSLQYLMNLVAKQQLGNGVRVALDANDYRQKRAEALTNLAVQIAEKVKERGEEAVLDALPAFERRVIHKALQEIEGVSTYSEGEEPDRRVVIAPLD